MSLDSSSVDLPCILIKGQTRALNSFSELGINIAKSNPAIRLASNFGSMADKLFMSEDLCLINFMRKSRATEDAAKRSRFWLGRMYNKFSGCNADYVELSGAVLGGAYRYLEDPNKKCVDFSEDYLLRRDVASDLLKRFEREAKKNGLLK
ncbi:MAG: hypothetical protein ABJO27_23110 [Pseudoruegeria sp.]